MTNPVAFVLLDDARLPATEVLIEALRRRHPGLLWGPAAAKMQSDNARLIRAGDHLIAIALISAPMPFEQQLWQQASWIWPDAFQAVRRHRAHLMVSSMGSAVDEAETAELSTIESTRLTTAVVGGLVESQPGCLGVAWSGKIGRSPEMWLEQSRSAFAPYPDQPFALWMEIVPYRSGKTIGAFTVGLSAFTGREIEFEVDGLDQHTVAIRVAQLSAYLIGNGSDDGPESGAVFEPDSEIDHRVAVLHRNSRFNIGPVISFSSLDDRCGRIRTFPIIPAAIARNHPLLVMLGKVGLFDPAQAENQIRLRPDHYQSEVRLESFDRGISQALSGMIATDKYAEADTNARRALASGDMASARSSLQPWAEEVGQLQTAAKLGLTLCDLFLFMPAPLRSP
ncbi:hypothetical protein A5906_07745 [Bradyrhizobium sacchari]|uniref:Uncharacterized protein n=1 Tax=Bradyrhizobium sacchari TaxID=1399419 RepID=A0A560KL14_9BRAD|nr:hypothetical protein [Bradyrhizobium sacchari]OPY95847.1 hypothetical protein A5906_07745 [Bradyrhizobium sacchari]TWB66726.1 hypothetical protein FBZ94_101404 [Bradyrhizobium sacchari]TWB83963.1 hypothetical protein FBZ95_101404 [Bradyrhizobium sacchari]